MGKRKMPNTVLLQLSFGIGGLFLKYIYVVLRNVFIAQGFDGFQMLRRSLVLCLSDNVFDKFLRISSMPFSLKSLFREIY